MADSNTNSTPDDFQFSTGLKGLPTPKLGKVSAEDIDISPLNYRFDGENNEFGVNTTSLDELEAKVTTDGEIQRPLIVERKGTRVLTLVGGRRSRVAKRILKNPACTQELAKAMRNIPAFIYPEGVLTDEQRLFIVNDQDQKDFRFSELVTLVFFLYNTGLKWYEVASRVYRQWGKLTGRADKLNQIDALPDMRSKVAAIKTWLRGSIDNVYGEAYRIGPKAMKALTVEALERDKLILTARNSPKDTPPEHQKPGPYCYLDQKRLIALRQAKAEDVAANNWNAMAGGPAFNAKWEEFHNEDYNPTSSSSGTPLKSLTRNALQELAKQKAQSAFAVRLLSMASGDKDVAWTDQDVNVATFEAKEKLVLAVLDQIKDDKARDTFRKVFISKDYDEFKSWLCTTFSVTPPVVEPTKPVETETVDKTTTPATKS